MYLRVIGREVATDGRGSVALDTDLFFGGYASVTPVGSPTADPASTDAAMGADRAGDLWPGTRAFGWTTDSGVTGARWDKLDRTSPTAPNVTPASSPSPRSRAA